MTANTHPGLKGMQLLRYFKGTQNVVVRDILNCGVFYPGYHSQV